MTNINPAHVYFTLTRRDWQLHLLSEKFRYLLVHRHWPGAFDLLQWRVDRLVNTFEGFMNTGIARFSETFLNGWSHIEHADTYCLLGYADDESQPEWVQEVHRQQVESFGSGNGIHS